MESGMGFRLDFYHFIYPLIFLLLHLLQPAITFNLETRSPIIFKGDKSSYFGYSVGLQMNLNRPRVLVGAPKEPRIQKINSFYQCEINRQSCDRIIISYSGGADNSNHWLGVTVDTNPTLDNNLIVCSHRNVTGKIDAYGYYEKQTGSCFEMLGTNIVQTIKYDVASTSGISARYSQDGNFIIIGCPTFGARDHGGYILKKSQAPAPSELTHADYFKSNQTYAGYAVNMVDGKVVLGIPRYRNYGAIIIGKELISAPENKFTFGSYFGSVLAVGDINADNKTDVIVGAPFYSEKYAEEGRVYIFHSTGSGHFSKKANEILSVPSHKSRFGTTVAVSDFNQDGFADILVGAPYENNGIGCIYLFNSYNKTLEKKPSQKIEGIKMHKDIRSFGISFSRAVDIDRNGYPDIAVGAYLSDQVVVLKSRPVVTVKTNLFARPNILPALVDPIWQTNEDIVLNITVFIYLVRIHSLVLNINLKADIEEPANRKRAYFENKLDEYSESVVFNKKILFSKTYEAKVKNKIYTLEPIKFSLNYHLENDGYGAWCTLCPFLKSGNKSALVKFDLLCGNDEICKTYFNLELSSPSSLLLSGESKYITVDATVENVEEHAYNTMAHIHFPSWIEYVTVKKHNNSINNVTCSVGSNQNKLSCFLGYPMREKSSTSFLLTFLANWLPIPKDLVMNMSVTTDSIVPKEYLNKTVSLTVPVKKKSVLKLFGMSETELHIHKGSKDEETVITHVFILENAGPSEAQNLIFYTLVPHLIIRNMTIMTLDSDQPIQNYGSHDQNSSDVCTTSTIYYSEDNIKTINKHILKAVNYDCSWMKCINVTCNFKELKKSRSKKIKIYIAIKNRYLEVLKGNMRNIYIKTTGELKQESKDYIIKMPDIQRTITTRVYIKPSKPTLKWWIPAASILSGILLVVLTSIILYEVGFFTRYQKLEEEKECLNSNEKTNEENTKEKDKESEKLKINNHIEKEGD